LFSFEHDRELKKMPGNGGSFRLVGCDFSVDSHVPPGEGYYLRSGRDNVRFEVLTAMFQSIQVFWDATLCSLVSVSHKPSDKAQPPIIPESPRRFSQLISRRSEGTFRLP